MSLDTLFSNVHNLPSIPKVVQDLQTSFGSDKANADAMAAMIAKDQAFAAKVLRLANSARYGVGRKIASIQSAVVLLGVSALRSLVMATGVSAAFTEVPGLDMKAFWKRSFTVGAICRRFARPSGCDPEVAFTCGIMHSIGILLIHMGEPDQCALIDQQVASGQRTRAEAEHALLGYDYAEVGAVLSRRWKFPEEIQYAVSGQLDPLASPRSAYAALIFLANYLLEGEAEGWDEIELLAHFPEEVAERLRLIPADVVGEWVVLKGEEDDIDELLS
ncbi:HDOD domain-containing protein [Pokkaliibacter sp. CJK22405]|uniref:HDOD domain-containing protein n=1 Tax=Pokkaliibacter sp. CJK22405 TaxID=3384615 RepID=UPI0039847DB1